jgi:hypothetical protein
LGLAAGASVFAGVTAAVGTAAVDAVARGVGADAVWTVPAEAGGRGSAFAGVLAALASAAGAGAVAGALPAAASFACNSAIWLSFSASRRLFLALMSASS